MLFDCLIQSVIIGVVVVIVRILVRKKKCLEATILNFKDELMFFLEFVAAIVTVNFFVRLTIEGLNEIIAIIGI